MSENPENSTFFENDKTLVSKVNILLTWLNNNDTSLKYLSQDIKRCKYLSKDEYLFTPLSKSTDLVDGNREKIGKILLKSLSIEYDLLRYLSKNEKHLLTVYNIYILFKIVVSKYLSTYCLSTYTLNSLPNVLSEIGKSLNDFEEIRKDIRKNIIIYFLMKFKFGYFSLFRKVLELTGATTTSINPGTISSILTTLIKYGIIEEYKDKDAIELRPFKKFILTSPLLNKGGISSRKAIETIKWYRLTPKAESYYGISNFTLPSSIKKDIDESFGKYNLTRISHKEFRYMGKVSRGKITAETRNMEDILKGLYNVSNNNSAFNTALESLTIAYNDSEKDFFTSEEYLDLLEKRRKHIQENFKLHIRANYRELMSHPISEYSQLIQKKDIEKKQKEERKGKIGEIYKPIWREILIGKMGKKQALDFLKKKLPDMDAEYKKEVETSLKLRIKREL